MKLATIDLLIILAYLVTTVVIGLIMKNRARESQSDYMLGGKKLPWYMLGLSNASDMFDISGTMWMVTICFVYGVKSMWIVWLWPVFNQIFQMMYLSKCCVAPMFRQVQNGCGHVLGRAKVLNCHILLPWLLL